MTVLYFAVDMINVLTFGDLNYERFWVSVSDRNALVFSVRSCGHVTIALSSVMYNTRVQVYICKRHCQTGYRIYFVIFIGKLIVSVMQI